MKALKDILLDIKTIAIEGPQDQQIQSLTLDSRQAIQGSMFFAQKGSTVDGHQFIQSAIEKGTTVVVCETLPTLLLETICYIQVESVQKVTGLIAANYYDHPASKFKVVGVTGTNGKTTVATLLFDLFSSLGYTCGLVSTVENKVGTEIIPATHTTPDAIHLQALFNQMVAKGCEYVFMEVSSHAIHQDRIAGTQFVGGIFTNITHDHLDYHKTFEEYIKVKKSFFDNLPKNAFALTNIDEKRGAVMLQNTKAEKKGYGLRSICDFKGKIFENNLFGLLMEVNQTEVHFRMSGMFNAYNLLAVYGAAICLGEDKTNILAVLSNLKGAKGRFETYQSKNSKILGIIDYAHTPDALQNVLSTIKQFNQSGKIITVVGCGGDRDKTKRPEMAEVAASLSTHLILTADNPRSEDPEVILDEMEAGLSPSQHRKVIRNSDRKSAIKTACQLAEAEDIILIAGKGHETYQEIKGVRHHFDDQEVLLEMFNLLEK